MRADLVIVAFFCLGASLRAEVLVRWDRDEIPSPASLGISSVVIPAGNRKAIDNAAAQGYDVYVEQASEQKLVQLQSRAGAAGARALVLERRGKWPHIRTNWVTKNNAVLQVTGRSAQPWIENNVALLRIAQAPQALLTYPWKPITLSEIDEGPALENYLVAIAEAGSFGGSLLLPLHERFQRDLLLGKPQARAAWSEIRRYIEFYSWDLPSRYRVIANIGVVAAEPMRSFEVMNLLARHNLPFEWIDPSRLQGRDLTPFKLLLVLDPDTGGPWRSATPLQKTDERVSYRFGEATVVEVLKAVRDPNGFALEIRRMLGAEHRVIDIWNGITVITAPYQEPDGRSVLVTVLNYAHQPLPVQLRVPGTFSQVHYESPEDPLVLLPYEHRNGATEFVLPALRVGGRVFLSQDVPRRHGDAENVRSK